MKVYTVTIEDPDGAYPQVFKTKKKRDAFLADALKGGLKYEIEDIQALSPEERKEDPRTAKIEEIFEAIEGKNWDEAMDLYNDFKSDQYPWEKMFATQTTLK